MSNPYQGIPSYEDIYGGQYFSPADLHEGAVTAKIVNLTYDEIFCKGVGKNSKIILELAGQKKKIVVNKTSAKALAYAWGKDFGAWKGKTVHADGGNVNGKAAVLLTPVKDKPVQKQTTLVAQALAATQGTVVQSEPGAHSDDESTDVVFVKISPLAGNKSWKYALLDATGCDLWRANEDVIEVLRTMKAKDRKIRVQHMMHCIESCSECVTT